MLADETIAAGKSLFLRQLQYIPLTLRCDGGEIRRFVTLRDGESRGGVAARESPQRVLARKRRNCGFSGMNSHNPTFPTLGVI